MQSAAKPSIRKAHSARRFLRPVLALLATSLALQWPQLAQAQTRAKPGFTIERIDARLYFHGSGKFSKVLEANAPLHNTIIGEGAAGEPSVATFVTVVVTGSAPENAMSHVLLEVTELDQGKRKPVLKQRAPVGFLNDSQKQSQVGFWLYDTGCGNLQISAKLGNERFKEPRGLHPAEYGKAVTQTLNFRCGE
jgi:hypothetical protein